MNNQKVNTLDIMVQDMRTAYEMGKKVLTVGKRFGTGFLFPLNPITQANKINDDKRFTVDYLADGGAVEVFGMFAGGIAGAATAYKALVTGNPYAEAAVVVISAGTIFDTVKNYIASTKIRTEKENTRIEKYNTQIAAANTRYEQSKAKIETIGNETVRESSLIVIERDLARDIENIDRIYGPKKKR